MFSGLGLRISENQKCRLQIARIGPGRDTPEGGVANLPVHLRGIPFASYWVELIFSEIAVKPAMVRHCCGSLGNTRVRMWHRTTKATRTATAPGADRN
jgi:hypothetical protein